MLIVSMVGVNAIILYLMRGQFHFETKMGAVNLLLILVCAILLLVFNKKRLKIKKLGR